MVKQENWRVAKGSHDIRSKRGSRETYMNLHNLRWQGTAIILILVAFVLTGLQCDSENKGSGALKKSGVQRWIPQTMKAPKLDLKFRSIYDSTLFKSRQIAWDGQDTSIPLQSTYQPIWTPIERAPDGQTYTSTSKDPAGSEVDTNLVRDILTFSDQHINLLLKQTGANPERAASCGPFVEQQVCNYFSPPEPSLVALNLPFIGDPFSCGFIEPWLTSSNQVVGGDWTIQQVTVFLQAIKTYHTMLIQRGGASRGAFEVIGLNYLGVAAPITDVRWAYYWMGDTLYFKVRINR